MRSCSDLSTSYDQDFIGIERGSFGTWMYGTIPIILDKIFFRKNTLGRQAMRTIGYLRINRIMETIRPISIMTALAGINKIYNAQPVWSHPSTLRTKAIMRGKALRTIQINRAINVGSQIFSIILLKQVLFWFSSSPLIVFCLCHVVNRVFLPVKFIFEEDLVQNDWDGYFWITEKRGSAFIIRR